MLIIFSRMEELVTLQYGNFDILGVWAKEFAQMTGCSNRVTNQTLRGQFFFNELWPEHLGWSTACKQESGPLFAGVPAPQHCLHEEKRALEHCKWGWPKQWPLSMPPSTPFRVHRHRNTKDCQAGLLGGVHSGAKCATPPAAWRVYEGVVPRTYQTYGQGWPTEQTWAS